MNEKAKCKNCTEEEMIEEMAQCKNFNGYTCRSCRVKTGCDRYILAAELIEKGYRNCKDKVVLTREDMKKYAKDCIIGQETGLDIINALIARAERYKEELKQARKETAKEILTKMLANAKRLKEQFNSTTYGKNKEHLIATIEIEIAGIKNLAKQFGVEVEE